MHKITQEVLIFNKNSNWIHQFGLQKALILIRIIIDLMTSLQPQHERQDFDNDLVVPFRSKNRFINLLFMNTEISKVTYKKTILFFLIISLIFLGVSMASVIEIQKQYYQPSSALCTNCNIQIKQTMEAPVYFMYKLGNFYQNHRRYIQSKSNYQLAGNQINFDKADVCSPKVTNKDMNKTVSWNNIPLDPNSVASPCGYIAYTYFTDKFTLLNSGKIINITESGISWSGDKGQKYKRAPNSASTQWIDPQNEHFIVWMRTSGLPNFKKLWGVVNQDLTPGNYTVQVGLNYNSSEWEGERYFVLTTKSAVGGKNFWLPSSFLIIGVLGLIAVIFFWKRMAQFKRQNEKISTQ